jgi:elongation factor P
MTFLWKDDLWEIAEFLHVKPGKGGAFVRTTLKNVKDGHEVEETFRAGAKVDEVRVERREHQYLYEDDYGLHFRSTFCSAPTPKSRSAPKSHRRWSWRSRTRRPA